MRAFVIANGPSLKKQDVDLCLGGGKVVAVNDAYRLAPWADVLYAADHPWWERHAAETWGFIGDKWTCNEIAARKHDLKHIPVRSDVSWSTSKEYVASGGNSGFQAINLAFLMGAREIILLGFDYSTDETGKKHWFGSHPGPLNKDSNYRDWLRRIKKAAPEIKQSGCRVINCSRVSAIDCFERMDLEDILCLS
jgi:hypothetical protein